MFSRNMLCSALLAILSVTSAAPATNAEGLTPVQFQGHTLFVNTAALGLAPTSPVERSVLEARATDLCGDSTIDPAPSGPYSLVSDCQVIRNYVITQSGAWQIGRTNGDYTKLIGYNSCTFKAGTYSNSANIGTADVGDLIYASIDRLQYGGLVGSRGVMACQGVVVHWAVVTV